MNIIKRICIAFTAAVSIGVLAASSITVSAAEKSLSPVYAAPYTVMMGINADKELWDQRNDNAEAISYDGDYSVSYDFQTGASSITTLVLDTNMDAASMPDAKITVNKIYIQKSDGYSVEIPFDASKAVQTKNANGCHRLNILYNFGPDAAKAIETSFPETATIYDKLAIDFTISGVADAPITTTAAITTAEVVPATTVETAATGTVTNTVSQTADPGVVAIVVAGTAAAALAAASLTARRKRK